MAVTENMQELAQRLLIFGDHVHIGVDDREFLGLEDFDVGQRFGSGTRGSSRR